MGRYIGKLSATSRTPMDPFSFQVFQKGVRKPLKEAQSLKIFQPTPQLPWKRPLDKEFPTQFRTGKTCPFREDMPFSVPVTPSGLWQQPKLLLPLLKRVWGCFSLLRQNGRPSRDVSLQFVVTNQWPTFLAVALRVCFSWRRYYPWKRPPTFSTLVFGTGLHFRSWNFFASFQDILVPRLNKQTWRVSA